MSEKYKEIEEKFSEVAKLQVELNNKLVPDWETANLDWKSAIIAEAGEFIESTGYKWWKKTEPDWENLKVEAIDLLHFLISMFLENNEFIRNQPTLDEKIEIFAKEMTQAFFKVDASVRKIIESGDPDFIEDPLFHKNEIKSYLRRFLIKVLKDDCLGALSLLVWVYYHLGMDEEGVYQAYGVKNLLNIYRSERGYKAGGYTKEVDGVEDNVAIANILKQLSISEKEKVFSEMDKLGYGQKDKQGL